MKKLAIITYGCQMNVHDSERIAGILAQEGYELTSDQRQADLILLNTCSIREKSEQKMFSELGRVRGLKTLKGNVKIGVCGCIAQQRGEEIVRRAPGVDLVFGTNNVHRVADLVREVEQLGEPITEVWDDSEFADSLEPVRRESAVQAWVSVMKGCNNVCTFCIVPTTRGRERSKPSDLVYREVTELAARGYKEVTLLGQNVNSYGRGVPGECDFPDLLARVNAIPGIERIRFVTSHPKDLSLKLMNRMAELDKVCEHLHLPVQSGSDTVLRRMKRAYNRSVYLRKVEQLRQRIPGISLTTDIIVGFPGETDQEFQDTMGLVREVEYDSLFLFEYSRRPGTEAATMPDQVPREVKQARFQQVLEGQKEITLSKNKKLEGHVEDILVEGPSKKTYINLTGRTRSNKIVHFPGSTALGGRIVPVRITRAGLYSLEGVCLESEGGKPC